MIYTERTITIRKGESKIDESIVVYRGDFELEIRFTIMNSRFKFMRDKNLIETEKASFGQLVILTPYGGNIFSDITRCSDGTVTSVLTKTMIDQIEEIGLYSFQIRLYDYNKESRVSIPPIEYGIEIREPIASEDHDNSVNNAIVGYSIAKVVNPEEENVGDTFDESGNYNKTKWETGDRISQGKLNKIEDAIDEINQNEKADAAALDRRITSNFNVLEFTKADKNEIFTMANMGQDVKEAMTGGSVAVVGKNSILTENIVDGQVTGDKIAEGVIRAEHMDPYLFTPKKGVEAIVSYTKEQTIDDMHLMIGVDMDVPAGRHEMSISLVYSNSLGDDALFGIGYSIDRLDFDNTAGWSTFNYAIAKNNSYAEHTAYITGTGSSNYVMFGLQIPRTEAQEYQRINISDVVFTLDGEDVTHLLKYNMHKSESRYTDVRILINSNEFIENLKDVILYDGGVTPDKISESTYKIIDDRIRKALDDTSNRLELLEGEFYIEEEVLDSYNYEVSYFNETSAATWAGVLSKAYPEGYMRNLTSKTSRGFTIGLATFNGISFTPYATYVMGEELPEIIPVKSDTFIIIHGRIGYNDGVVSVDPHNFYDIYGVDDKLTVGVSYDCKISDMNAGFDISFEIVSRQQSRLVSIQSDIKHLKEHMNNSSNSSMKKIQAMEHQITSLIHAVEENIPEAGNEPKVLENQLVRVWDNDLSKEHEHWVKGNSSGSIVSNGFTATDPCWYVYDQYLTFDTFRQKAIVTVNDASSVFGLVCKHTQKGALYLVHGDTNTITLHGQYTGESIIPSVKATTQLPFTITAGKKYLLDVFKTGWKHTFTITDMETMVSASVMFDNSTQSNSGYYCGKGWGGPGVISISGDVVFHNHRYYVSNYKTPRVMFIGDSITEGTNMGAGADIKYRWCSLLRSQYFGYDALICGRGGATSGDILQRMNAFETLDIKPDIVIILDGTNERSDSGLSGWKTNMPLIVSKIESWGAKPIICVPPVSSSGFDYIAVMRDFILAQGWNTIRMDIATSLNHDGHTYDSSLYTDGVHPNIKGSQQMFERAVQDLNVIL